MTGPSVPLSADGGNQRRRNPHLTVPVLVLPLAELWNGNVPQKVTRVSILYKNAALLCYNLLLWARLDRVFNLGLCISLQV